MNADHPSQPTGERHPTSEPREHTEVEIDPQYTQPLPEPTGTGAEERLKGLPQIRVCEHGYQITEMNGRWVHHLDARLNNGRGGELCGAPEGAYEIVDVAPASDLAALQERLEEERGWRKALAQDRDRALAERDSLAENQLTREEADALLRIVVADRDFPAIESARNKLTRLSQFRGGPVKEEAHP